MTLSLFLLGQLYTTLQSDQPLELSARKAQALLAYLAVEANRTHYREALAGLLWPDYPDQAARSSLRHALWNLRQAIGDSTAPMPFLLISRETVRVNPEADYWLDVSIFERATAAISRSSSRGISPTDAESLRSAVALYRGPFLEGFSLGDSSAFEEWLLLKREQLNRQMLLALHALATFYEARDDHDQALAWVWRAIELEPWYERAHLQAMRLLTFLGRRSEALAQYRRCKDLMMRELGASPGAELTALYEHIHDGTATGALSSLPISAESKPLPPHSIPAERNIPPLLLAREEELARLDGFLSQALAGEGRVALVIGEAGSGKTVLMEGFVRQAMARQENLLALLGRCSAHGGAGDTFEPFREIMRVLTGDLENTLSTEHARRIEAALPLNFAALCEQGPDLMRLLVHDPALAARARACIPHHAIGMARMEALAAQAEDPRAAALQQTALCEQAGRVLRTIAQRQPLLILFDDLQWADAPSLDMLFYLGRHLRGSRILFVGTYRAEELDLHIRPHPLSGIVAEFQRQWGDIHVDLDQFEARRFVDAYLDSWPNRLGASFRETLAGHTGGNALFTTELVRAMQERGDLLRGKQGHWIEGANLDWAQLPPRVEGAISQRIGQLSAAQQDLLETASIEGEQFHAEVLARVLGLSVQDILATLSGPLSRQAHLVVPHGLIRVGERTLARYRFRHGIFQSYLYGRLDAVARAYRHESVGSALEALCGGQATPYAGQLARHFEAAGHAERAARYLLAAGQQAVWVGANGKAVVCYERALALLSTLPATSECAGTGRTEIEFALQMALDRALLFALGWGTPERLRTSGRAFELGQQMGWSDSAMFRALRSMADLSQARGEYQRANTLARELLAIAERAQVPLYVASAHAILGVCLAVQGNLAQAWEHTSHVLDFWRNPPYKLTDEDRWALRPHTGVLAAFVLLAQGHIDQAREQIERSAASNDLSIPHSAATTLCLVAICHALLHEDRLAQKRVEEALRGIGAKGLPESHAWGEVVLGWVDARDGQAQQGIDRITAALSRQPTQSTLIFRFVQTALAVEAHLAGGETDLALSIVDRTLDEIARTGTRYYEAELWRLRGEIVLHGRIDSDNAAQEAEDSFRRALEIARTQGARLWELRATVSMARLWVRAGKAFEAKEALAAIYATFTEGLDTPDLLEAKMLLDGLGQVLPSGARHVISEDKE